MQKRYLTVCSQERTYGTPSNFSLSIRNGMSHKQCMLIMAMLPNTYFNVTLGNNGILINGDLKTIPPGNYNLDEFFNYFATQVDDSITGISYNDVSSTINITTSPAITISFPQTGSMNFIIGFPSDYSQLSDSHNSSFPPSLTKFNLYIEINELSSNHTTTNPLTGNYTFEIPNNVNKNQIIKYYKKYYPQIVNCKMQNEILYNLTIKIKNQYNEIVQGLADWAMILCFY